MNAHLKHDSVRWMLAHEPAELAHLVFNSLRSRSRTGDIRAAQILRSLGFPLEWKAGKGKQSGSRRWALWIRNAIINLRNGRGHISNARVNALIAELPDRPALDFNAWFNAAWELHILDVDPTADAVTGYLARSAASGEHKPITRIKNGLKAAARRAWGIRPSRKSPNS